jgi:hypothetical protein
MNGRESRNEKLSCKHVRRVLPGYLDGAIPEGGEGNSHAAIHAHLAECQGCRHELSRYQVLQQMLAKRERVAPPADLGVQIRMAMARAREVATPTNWLRRLLDRADLVRQNIVAPVALPATGGLVAALMVFAVVMPTYARVAPLQQMAGVSDELPAALLQPARLESLPDFSVAGLGDNSSRLGLVVVDASVGVSGDVVDYQIVSGPDDAAIRRQLDQILLFSRFRPQMSFGRPISGGHVVMSFSTVTVNVKG